MRVNVYGEELTTRIELLTKEADDFTFFGLRFWLRFPNQDWWVHRKVDGRPDDDSTAVTFWAPSREELHDIFAQAMREIEHGASVPEMASWPGD